MTSYTFGYTFEAATVEDAQGRLEELIATEGAGDPYLVDDAPPPVANGDGTVTIEFPVRVTVPADNRAITRANQVMAERTGYDEQYADEDGTEYDYRINWG